MRRSPRINGRGLSLVPDLVAEPKFSADTTYVVGPTASEQRTVVLFGGELDLTNAAAVGRVLSDVTTPATLDFSGVSYIDAAVLTELATFARRVRPHRALIFGLQPQVRRVLETVEFSRIFAIEGGRLSIVSASAEASGGDPPRLDVIRHHREREQSFETITRCIRTVAHRVGCDLAAVGEGTAIPRIRVEEEKELVRLGGRDGTFTDA